jgi:hypothetical protein
MNGLTNRFGSQETAISDTQRSRIKSFYDSAFKKMRDAAVNRMVSGVRVRPEEDPYAMGFIALFTQEGNSQKETP